MYQEEDVVLIFQHQTKQIVLEQMYFVQDVPQTIAIP